MTTSKKIKVLRDLLSEMKGLLLSFGEKNWIAGINAALSELDSSEISIDLRYERARSIYATMNRGPGSFADFNVWRDDFSERQNINNQIEILRDKLWIEFDL